MESVPKAVSGKLKNSDLQKGKDEANGEVGQPVEATSNSVGSRSVGLLKELCSDQERHSGCEAEPETHSFKGCSWTTTQTSANTDLVKSIGFI